MHYEPMIEQLKRHEGLRLAPYKCTQGYWTIGYGRNLETNGLSEDEQRLILGRTMPKASVIEYLQQHPLNEIQADELLYNDVANVEDQLYEAGLLHGHNEARQAVLINMCFQLGFAGLGRFTRTLHHVRCRQYDKAADEMLDSRWCMQTPARAKELSDQMRTGEFA